MILELEKSSFGKIRQLLVKHGLENYNVLASILEGENRFRIFVDNLEAPSTAFVWAINCMFYFIGDHNNPDFNDYFTDFMKSTIAPDSLKMGSNAFVCTLLNEEGWKETVERYFIDIELDIGYRQDFSFNKDRFLKLSQKEIPNNCRIVRIDKEIIAMDKSGYLEDDISEFWNSLDDFIQKGIGFCLIENQRVVSNCFSCYSSKDGVDINIITYDNESRSKGFATLTASVLIDHCISENIKFSWEAYDNNYASIVLAEKLGFEKSKKYLCYEFPLNELSDKSQLSCS